MSKNQDKYKPKPAGFTDMLTGRFVRAQMHEERRRNQRDKSYAKHRIITSPQSNIETTEKRTSVNTRLIRWKKEREFIKKMEAQKKKPVFKVGIVHHKFFSPPVSSKNIIKDTPCHGKHAQKSKQHETPAKRITRATAKRLEAKAAAAYATPTPGTSKKTPKSTVTMRRRLPSMTKKPSVSFAPGNYTFTAPQGLSEIPLFGRFAIPNNANDNNVNENKEKIKAELQEPWPCVNQIVADDKMRRSSFRQQYGVDRLRPDSLDISNRENSSIEMIELHMSSEEEISPPKIAVEIENSEDDENFGSDANDIKQETPPRSGTPVPASFSPYVVSSRGKDSARKEQMGRMGLRRSCSNDIPTKDTVMENINNISIMEEERTAKYFTFILDREIERLKEVCDKWEEIMNEPDLPEDSRCQINQAIGQTKLLMRKKFVRFRSLVYDCETGKGQMLVSCVDLQGFWDLIYMEVKDCDSRFDKLEILKSKNWVEERIPMRRRKVTTTVAIDKPKINAKSSMRSFILKARQKKISSVTNDDIVVGIKDKSAKSPTPLSNDNNSRRSVRKSPTKLVIEKNDKIVVKATPNKTPISLRKAVQLSEASKSVFSPLAVMKISKMCKTPEVTMDDTISYINSDQTPGKGILKKSDSSDSDKSCLNKSTRKVDFNDDVFEAEANDNDEINEELQNSIDLGRALARIESYDDYIDEIPENITIRDNQKRLNFEDPSFNETINTNTAESTEFVAAIPESPIIPIINIIPETPLRTVTDESEKNTSINQRVLRNRTVAASKSNTTNRRSRRTSVVEQQNTISNENNDPMEIPISSETMNESYKNINDDSKPKRRSTRKSVRFNADDCTTCTPKLAMPVTPHARRSRKISLLGDTRISTVLQTNEDLMSFGTPEELPARIQRSSFK